MKTLYIKSMLLISLLLSSTLFANSIHAQDSQLQNLFEMTLQNNPTIHYAQAQQSAALSEQKMMQSYQQPSVHYQGDLGYAMMQKNSFARGAHKLEATYPLYQPDKDDLYAAASYRFAESKYQLEEIEQELLLQVSKQYFQYWAQTAELVFMQKEFESISEIMAQVKQRFKIGYQDINDISAIQARLDRTQADLLRSEQALQLTRINLEALVNAKIDWKVLVVPEGLPEMIEAQGSETDWAERVKTHPSLQRLDQAQLAASKQIDYAKSRDGILVEAYGAYINNQSDGFFYDDMQGMKAGLSLKIPLYLGGKTQAAVTKAQSERQQVKARKKQKALMLAVSMKTALVSYQSGLKQLKALKAVKYSNEQAVKAAEQGLITGNRSVLELLDVQRDLHRAQRDIRIVTNTTWQNWYLYEWSEGQIAKNR